MTREELLIHIQETSPSLLCKDMFDMYVRRILDDEIEGELETRKVIFLCAMGCLVLNSNTASYNLLVNDLAGAGKDYITSRVLSIIPEYRLLKRTRISPTAFTYWHNSKLDPNWTWNGKVLYLEDVSNSVLNSEVFKVMCSSGSHATIVKDQKAIDIEIKGKPVLIITSASAAPNPELVRRFAIVSLDSGINQTEAIVKRHLKAAKKGGIIEKDTLTIQHLCQLIPVKVKIPYAEKLYEYIPTESIIMRTHILRFLDYIKASTALHQFQREIDEDEYYIATEQDYQIAREVMLKTTTNEYMIPLTKDQKRILDIFEKTLNKDAWYSVQDLQVTINWMCEKWMRVQLDKLVEYGLLIKENQEVSGNSSKKIMVYSYLKKNILSLPKKLEK